MGQLTSKDLAERMSKRLASSKISDELISKLAEHVIVDGWDLKKFDVCIYGLCIDYFTPRVPKLDSLFTRKGVSRVEVFPYGIIDWDHFHVRIGYSVDGLNGHLLPQGHM